MAISETAGNEGIASVFTVFALLGMIALGILFLRAISEAEMER